MAGRENDAEVLWAAAEAYHGLHERERGGMETKEGAVDVED